MMDMKHVGTMSVLLQKPRKQHRMHAMATECARTSGGGIGFVGAGTISCAGRSRLVLAPGASQANPSPSAAADHSFNSSPNLFTR
jgi:hypothetical protein